MGAKPYTIITNYIKNITDSVVEIGSERNEGSTTFLSEFCFSNKRNFYTVDFDKNQYLNALHITKGHGAYNMLGEEFLGNIFPLLNKQISFAYLDNFDLETADGRNWDKRKSLYQSYGLQMNNTNSKIAHMTQALLVEKHSAKHCLILFDDTWINEKTNEFEGKGAWAIRPLLQCGFKIVNDILIGNEEQGLSNGYALLERDLTNQSENKNE